MATQKHYQSPRRSSYMTGSPSPGHGHNWLNETSRELNGLIRQHRQQQPSLALKQQWHAEYLSSGAQYRTTYPKFLRHKIEQWHQQREVANWEFGTGKYQGKSIAGIFRHDLGYIEWILQNQPRGKTAKQIVNFVTRYPAILEQVKRK